MCTYTNGQRKRKGSVPKSVCVRARDVSSTDDDHVVFDVDIKSSVDKVSRPFGISA